MKSIIDYINEAKYYGQMKAGKLYLDNKEYKGYYMYIELSSHIFNKKYKEWQNSTDYVTCTQCGNRQLVFYNEDVNKMKNINFDDMFDTEEKGHVLAMILYKEGKIQDDIFQNGKWVK